MAVHAYIGCAAVAQLWNDSLNQQFDERKMQIGNLSALVQMGFMNQV